MNSIIIFGVILFSVPPGDLSGATARIRLLDTTLADAPSITLVEQEIVGPTIEEAAERGIRFQLTAPKMDVRRRYEIWVHVDMNRSGDVSAGDFLSTQSYPVAAHPVPKEVKVKVNPV